MTRREAEEFLLYATQVYPSARFQDIAYAAQVWSTELRDESREDVLAAFRIASTESQDWMPTAARIKAIARQNAEQTRRRTPDAEFRDAHGGRSREEWDALIAWEQSADGIAKLHAYRERLARILDEIAG